MTLITKIATGRGAGLTTVIRCRASVPRAPPAPTSRTLRGGTARDLLELSGARRGGSGFTRSSPTERSSGAPGPVQQPGLRRRGEPVGRGGTVDHARTGPNVPEEIQSENLAGVDYLRLPLAGLDAGTVTALGRLSARWRSSGARVTCLHPVPVPPLDWFDDDLVGIPKYPGKTNEQFTRLLVNVTAASATRELGGGRGDLGSAVRAGNDPEHRLDPGLRRRGCRGGSDGGRGVRRLPPRLPATEADQAPRRVRAGPPGGSQPGPPAQCHGDAGCRRAGRCPSPCSPATPGSRRRCSGGGGSTWWSPTCRTGSCTAVAKHDGADDRRVVDLVEEALPVWAGQLKRGGALGLELEHLHDDPGPAQPGSSPRPGSGSATGGPVPPSSGTGSTPSIHRDVLVAVNDSASASGKDH